ncbi:M28 family peptidase [Winogradskyella sp. 3972H.M.0a.05]|uniref:M28 family peptidase n=1 Tax=Winogradskyella sp. 3972H.M.0a.05 TaxID=2950277 RepID=UPI00339402B6
MKSIFALLAAGLLITGCGPSAHNKVSKEKNNAPADPVVYAETITADEIKDMLYVYASDEFEGRETGEPGQKKAVEYLKAQYQSMEIPSPLKGDDYFQEVPLQKRQVAKTTITINDRNFAPFDHQFCLLGGTTQTITASDVVYAGYGVESEGYSDYKDLDVKDKVVLIKAGEAKNEDGTYVTTGTAEPTKWSGGRQSMFSKRNLARDKGARAILLMDEAIFPRYATYYSTIYNSSTSYASQGGRMSLKDNGKNAPFFLVDSVFAKVIYDKIVNDHTPKSITANLTIDIENSSKDFTSENVVAFIEGSEKPDEIVVISAHLDHVGVDENKEVFNGADDDGSGTVAVVEIAEAFKEAQKNGHGPKRSILFLHVTGEEKGLLGSKYYTDMDPIFPLENTVANLNIDMIGRVDPKRKTGDRNYVYLIGSDKLSTELHNISEDVNLKYCNVELDYKYNDENDPNRFYYRSDHYNFAKNNIPVIFYFNGTHDDYHKITDTPDKIEYDLLENRARLVFHTAWELANRDERIVVDKAEASE